MNVIDAQDVRFAYTTEEGVYQFALNGVSIEIPKGSFTAILGHNGSGKSTFARLINALNVPTEGKILVNGMDTADESLLFDIRKSAGMVFQNPDNQLVATIVEEDIAFGPENLGLPQKEIVERVENALKAVGMSEYRRRAPHMLSGGQKQRIAIAGALALGPNIIVFDESTAMLDPKGRADILNIIRKLNKENEMTIILITHYLEETVDADDVIILLNGLLLARGKPVDILFNREVMAQAGLLPPFVPAMWTELVEAGIPLKNRALHMDELVKEIVAAKPKAKGDIVIEPRAIHDGRGAGIEISGLSYTYMPGSPFEHKAVDNIDLSIKPGEFVGIIGHTGSGKSTLIQMISGLIRPDSGKIVVDGDDITASSADKKKLRRTVGMVFQYPEYQLFEETVALDISYGPKKLGVPENELDSRVRVAMGLVGLDYEIYKDKSPFELSGGQKRKAAIAGVLAMEPQILIMDEPIAGLDPMGRENLMELVLELNRCGTTIIMVSHNMDGLAEYASRVIAMSAGKILLNGNPEDVFSNYETLTSIGLQIPEAALLVASLNKENITIPHNLIRYKEVQSALINMFEV